MKRFTETDKWEKPWFQDMEPKMKLLWIYLMDKCNAGGIYEINLRLASFQLGETITQDDLMAFGERVELLSETKLWIKKFSYFQIGTLSEASPPHKKAIIALEKEGLLDRPEVSLSKGNARVNQPSAKGKPRAQEEEEEEDKEKEKETARKVIDYLNAKTGSSFSYCESNLTVIIARMKPKGVTYAGVCEMIDNQVKQWGDDPKMSAYLKPVTLFRASNFDGYYGTRKKQNKATGPVDATGRKIQRFK